MKVLYATINDIEFLEKCAEECFKNVELDKMNFSYCKQSFKDNVSYWIKSPSYVTIKCVDHDESIVGFMVSHAGTEIFNNQKAVMDVFITQVAPHILHPTKVRAIKKMNWYMEDICREVGIQTISIDVVPSNDMQKFLIRNKYKQSDIVMYKELKIWDH